MLERKSKEQATITIPLSHYIDLRDCAEMSHFKFSDCVPLSKKIERVLKKDFREEDQDSED